MEITDSWSYQPAQSWVNIKNNPFWSIDLDVREESIFTQKGSESIVKSSQTKLQ